MTDKKYTLADGIEIHPAILIVARAKCRLILANSGGIEDLLEVLIPCYMQGMIDTLDTQAARAQSPESNTPNE